MAGQAGFSDADDRLKRLSDLGDQLDAFAKVIDFELIRPDLLEALAYSSGAQGGRPPFDPVMMLKILVIQAANTLLDERTEFLINDRLSFMRFLGLGLSDRVPDARTIWLFREKRTKACAIQPLFDRLDASLIAAPKQRNTRAEWETIKQSEVPAEWQKQPAKLRQKDRQARWTGEVHQGQAVCRRQQAAGGYRHSELRLPEPHRHRPPLRPDPAVAGHRCCGL